MGAARKVGAVVAPALAIGAGVGLAGPVAPAGAADPVVPMYGDLTGDGIADRVVFPTSAGSLPGERRAGPGGWRLRAG